MFSQFPHREPQRPASRSASITIRLTPAEQQRIEAIANRLYMPVSTLARFFILEAVDYHVKQNQQGGES